MAKAEAGPAPMVYEVRLAVELEIAPDFDAWLDGHVREMIALPGFYDARIIRADPGPDGRVRRLVRYRLRDRAALDNYLEQHAEAMRRDALERFGDRFSAERDIYPALPAEEEAGEHRCPNCGAVANQHFCASCGQEQKDYHVRFWRLLKDFLGDTLTFDSRLFRSLGPLIRRPGFLTREFIEGRRMRYIPPLRLYLFISIVFFALMNTLMDNLNFDEESRLIWSTGETAVESEAPEKEDVPASSRGGSQSAVEAPPAGSVDDWQPEGEFERRLKERAKRVEESPTLFLRDLVENIPLMMFLMLPLYALLMRILYPLADYVYMEHLVFSLHVHALYFLMFTLQLVNGAWLQPAVAPYADLGPIQTGLGVFMLLYPLFAMRRVYRQPWWATVPKYLVLGIVYWLILGAGVTGMVLATFYWF